MRPLLLLVSGALTSVILWRLLMFEPAPAAGVGVVPNASERLSRQDRDALDGVLKNRSSRP